MVKVKSLKRTIIVQFAVILVPLIFMLGYQSMRNASRSAEMNTLFHNHDLALTARDQYRTFLDGAADAVDTAQLSTPALEALSRTGELLGDLGNEAGSPSLVETARDIAAMAAMLATDRSLPALQRLHSRINANRVAIWRSEEAIEKQMDAAIGHSIAEADRDTQVVSVASVLLLAITIWFIARMIRDLSRPLNLAVSVANRIAEGREVPDGEFRSERDIGNLLGSLEGMYGNLARYRAEVDATRQSLEEKVRQVLDSEKSLAEAQQLAQLGSWHWDLKSPTGYWSEQMFRILGTEPGKCEAVFATFTDLLKPPQQRLVKDRLRTLRLGAGSFTDEFHVHCLDGIERIVHHRVSSKTNPEGEVVRLSGTIQDITTRRQAEEEIRRLAHYDSLTGLPNRQFFYDQLEHAVARAKREGEQLATLFLDLDRFKRINDTLGHAAGDALLKEVSARLSACIRDCDYLTRESGAADETWASGTVASGVARLAGDEFTAILVGLKRPQDAAKVAQRILHELTQPFHFEGNEIVVTASVGISLYPVDGDSADNLLKNADTAMYRAKELGKNTYQFFTNDMNTTAFAKLTLENELRKAIERDQFVLYYQPKVEAASGKIAGVEALIRWSHPEWGLMAPGQFIPMAEEAGLITAIGDWVLEAACRQLRKWRDCGLPTVSVAINLASPSFGQNDLALQVHAALDRNGVEPHLLQLEATETMMMTNVERTMQTLTELREIGVTLSIDDFGTGYSSLSYLRKFPIDQLKIDRSFVTDMTTNADDAAIVAAIVSLGRALGLEVVAEGVETRRQACLLRDLGCNLLQGYYFSRPVPADEIAALLRGVPFSIDALHSTQPMALAPVLANA